MPHPTACTASFWCCSVPPERRAEGAQIKVEDVDSQRLRAEAEKVKQIFRDIPIAARVRDDWEEPSAREVVHVNADRANLAHLTNADVSDSIDAALHGITSGALRAGDKQVPIVGRMRMEERAQLSDLRSVYLLSRQDAPPVPLDEVATISLDPVTPKIRRFDQYRTITVQCWSTEGHLPSEVIAAAMPKLTELMLRLAERRFRSPLFMREWESIRDEFESFPEFVTLVTSVHRIPTHMDNVDAGLVLTAQKEVDQSPC